MGARAIDDAGVAVGLEGVTETVPEFFAMGGYGAYVWPAFGFTLIVLLGLLVASWRASRRRQEELAQLRELVRPSGGSRPVVRRPERPSAGRHGAPRTRESERSA